VEEWIVSTLMPLIVTIVFSKYPTAYTLSRKAISTPAPNTTLHHAHTPPPHSFSSLIQPFVFYSQSVSAFHSHASGVVCCFPENLLPLFLPWVQSLVFVTPPLRENVLVII